MTIVDIISIALIIILGVPHGSLDGVIARKLGLSKNLMEWISFNVLYLSTLTGRPPSVSSEVEIEIFFSPDTFGDASFFKLQFGQ